MSVLFILALALALAMDAFTVSLGVSFSLRKITLRQVFRMSLHFGFFQFLMAYWGWLLGQTFLKYIQTFDHWVAFGLLSFVGGKMIYESLTRTQNYSTKRSDPTAGFYLIFLSVATSIDALAAGLSLAALHSSIFYPSLVIGIVAFLMSFIGARMGRVLGRLIGRRAEILGGIILIIIGLKILRDHLF
ncbi:manganese efflux pump [bacterium]|nr:manganese efflux pump [bacterium]